MSVVTWRQLRQTARPAHGAADPLPPGYSIILSLSLSHHHHHPQQQTTNLPNYRSNRTSHCI